MQQTERKRDMGAAPQYRRQRGFVSSRQALVLLGLLFLTPVFVAWFMHMSAESGWRPGGTTNKGVLIQPPRSLSLPQGLVDTAGEPLTQAFLNGKWTLVYIDTAACGTTCRERLDAMHWVRIALGENMRRVQSLFLAAGSTDAGGLRPLLADHSDLAAAGLALDQAAAIAPVFSVDGLSMQDAGNIYLVDPLGNLMMYYRPGTDPRDVLQDLQRLLKYSHIG